MKVHKTAIFLLILLFLSSCDHHVKGELLAIGNKLSQLDSIEDFSSNRNKPVEGVENIGQNLYAKLRSARNQIIKIEVMSGRDFGDVGGDYAVMLTKNDSSRLGIKFNKKGSFYAIVGYSGGTNW